MALILRYKPTAVAQINAYLALIEDQFVSMVAVAELRRELGKLAADPRLGTAPTGPFESRPIYKFRLEAGDRPRIAQVSYHANEEAGELEILLFSAVPV